MTDQLGAAERLLAKAVAYGACAKLLGPFSQGSVPEEAVEWLRRTVAQLGLAEGQAHLQAFLEDLTKDPEGYRAEYVRVFDRGAVPPYEASHATSTPQPLTGPNVQQMADVAGFYRAFGFGVRQDRPDHLGAELEFLALVCTQEAYARLVGRGEEAQVCARAREAFLRDHLTGWLPLLCHRVREASPRPALVHLVGLVAALARHDAAELNSPLDPSEGAGPPPP